MVILLKQISNFEANKIFFSGFCNNVPDGPLTQSGRDTLLASPPLEAERRAETSLAAPAADTSATSERNSSSCGSEQNNDIFKDLSEFDPDDTEDSGFQCGHCSDKFMSETSMRIHAVRCSRSRQQSVQSDEMLSSGDIRR